MTCHLDNPLSAGAMGTGEGAALLAAFGTAMGTTEIHSQNSKHRHQAQETTARMKSKKKESLSLNAKPVQISNPEETAGVAILH